MSGGQRKLLEMARALMVGPEMVMLDEPMAGVNPALTQSLLGHVKDLREDGHDRAVRRARHGHGPRHQRLGHRHGAGQGHRRGPARTTIMANEAVIDAYLGGHHDAPLDRGRGAASSIARPPRPSCAQRGPPVSEPIERPARESEDVDEVVVRAGDPRGARSADRSAHLAAAESGAAALPTRSSPATSPASTSSTAATSTSATASWSASSARTAPASRRCSRRCSAW